jgi:hypothetical protein
MAGIKFATPQGLKAECNEFDAITVCRLRHPTARMELSVLSGPWDALMKAATQTSVRYFPPEGKAMTDKDREMLGRTFLGAVKADLDASLAGEGQEPSRIAEEHKGRTTAGYVFLSQILESDGGVAQGTSVVFDPGAMRAALVAFRSAAAHVADVKKWSDAVGQSIGF